MNVEFVGLDKQAHLGSTVCQWLTTNSNRADVPYTIENVQPNTASIVDMKVSAAGTLVAAAGESSGGSASGGEAAAPEEPDTRVQGGFSAGTGSGGSNFGGLTGRRRPTGETQVRRPGGLLGGTGSDGGFNAGNSGDAEYRPDGAQGNQFQRQGGQAGGSESKVDLDKVAPIPERPGVYPPDSTVHIGKVTFTVKFKEAIPAAAPAAEGM
jgi:hypothetical protein